VTDRSQVSPRKPDEQNRFFQAMELPLLLDVPTKSAGEASRQAKGLTARPAAVFSFLLQEVSYNCFQLFDMESSSLVVIWNRRLSNFVIHRDPTLEGGQLTAIVDSS
jgi:hypothetical protein